MPRPNRSSVLAGLRVIDEVCRRHTGAQMIEQWSEDRTGYALFSDDMTMRYALKRALSERAIAVNQHPTGDLTEVRIDWLAAPMVRVCFLLCNPSDADAFEPDPTVGECVKRARQLGADVLEVANLWALVSPYPSDLRKRAVGVRGDDETNTAAILAACTGSHRVIAGWGNNGELDHRAPIVMRMLAENGVKLYHLGMTKDGHPKHPLARGVHRIPADLQPTVWEYA